MTGFASLQDCWGTLQRPGSRWEAGKVVPGGTHIPYKLQHCPQVSDLVPAQLGIGFLAAGLWEIWALRHGNTALVWFWPRVSAESPRGLDSPFYFLVWAVFLPPVSLLSKQFSILAWTQRTILEQLRRFAKNRAWNMLLPHTHGCLSVLPHANKNTSFFCFLLITAGDLHWRRKHLIY